MPGSNRADARRNRDAILAAAPQVLAEYGPDAPIDLLVQRTGLGRATIYRNFPDRPSLLAALLSESLERLAVLAPAVVADAEAEQGIGEAGFVALLECTVSEMVDQGALFDILGDDPGLGTPVISAAQERLEGLFIDVTRRAQDCGWLARGFTLGELPVLLTMVGACLRGRSGPERRVMADRALALALNGVRARNRLLS